MKILNYLQRCLWRFRYPFCLPSDIAAILGIKGNKYQPFETFIHELSTSQWTPTRLKRMMRRELAEETFSNAQCKERFKDKTLVSYYFPQGWLEFILLFDEQARLRRMYIQHKYIQEEQGIEIPLPPQCFSNECVFPELKTIKPL